MSEIPPLQGNLRVRRFSFRRTALQAIPAVIALALFAPYLASIEPGRSFILRKIFPNVHGSISATDTRFSWTETTRIEGLQIRSPQGEQTVSVELIEVEAPFWKFLFPPTDLGKLTIRRPELHIKVRDNSNNFAATFPPPAKQPDASPQPAATPTQDKPAPKGTNAVAIDVQDLIVSWNLPGTGLTHQIDRINFRAKIQPAGAEGFTEPTLVIEPTVVFDHVKLTQAMSNDFLAFIAPPFAGVTKVEGEVSLALEGGALPLRNPGQGKLTGELGLHRVVASANGIPKLIADKLKVPVPDFDFAPESVVPFELSDGRVTHRDLEFGLGALRVQTAGYVSLDRKLDLLAHIYLRAPLEKVAERPLLRALNERGVLFPIKGTLNQPAFDNHLLAVEGLDLLSTALGNWRENKPESVIAGAAQNLYETLRQRGVIVPPPPSPAPPPAPGVIPNEPGKPAPAGVETLPTPPGQATTPPQPQITPSDAVDIGKQAIDLLQELAKQRRARLEQEGKLAPGTATEPPKKRPLGKLLDRLRGSEPPAAEAPKQ